MKNSMTILMIYLIAGILGCPTAPSPPHHLSLKLVDSLKLPESTEFPLAGAKGIAVSPSGNLMLLADDVSGAISLYQYPKCVLLKAIAPPIEMSDSLAENGYKWMDGYHFVTREQRPTLYPNSSAGGGRNERIFFE
jgi:hypothetical protein